MIRELLRKHGDQLATLLALLTLAIALAMAR